MWTLIVKRLLLAIPTLLILITISFLLMRSAPGTPFAGERNLPPSILKSIEAQYHLDKPLYQQYLYYLGDLLRGDLGPSFTNKDYTVNELVSASFPVSLKIGFWAFVLAVAFGIGVGGIAALRQNTWIDYSFMSLAMIGIAVPTFVLAPLLVYVFAIQLDWTVAGGWNDGSFKYLILPVIAMSMHYVATIARVMRGSMIEVLSSNYIRTARAKGLPGYYILFGHALRPALLPVVAYLGPAFVGIITGSVVVETIFGLPGIGQLFVNGALNRDYSMVLGLTVLIGALTIMFTTIVDILYAMIDPRIRFN